MDEYSNFKVMQYATKMNLPLSITICKTGLFSLPYNDGEL